MATENKIAEAVAIESEGEKRSITCELLDPTPNKFSSEVPEKSLGMQDPHAEITELSINAENMQSSSDLAECMSADTKDIDGAPEGKKFLESSSEAAILKKEDSKQLRKAEALETDDRTTDEEKHFQEEEIDRDYDTDDVTQAVSRIAKSVEANVNIIEEQRTEELLDKNVDTGCGRKVDCTDNVVNMDPTFALQNIGENVFDVQSKVSAKLLDLPAEQKAPESLDICKQTENEKVEIEKIIQSGASDASIAAVAESSDNSKREFTLISDEGGKNSDESPTIVAADNSTKHDHEVDLVELEETTSTQGQEMTESSAEMKHVMPAGENEEYKINSTRSVCEMDAEEANDTTQETNIQAVQNSLAEEEDGLDQKENLDTSSAKHVESMQGDYSNAFNTKASEGEREYGGYLTGEVVMDGSGQGTTEAEDHIAKKISSAKAESVGSFLQQSLPGAEQPQINTEVLEKAVSCIKEEAHRKSPQKVDEDDSVHNRPNDEESQEDSSQNQEGDQQRSDAANLEIECEKVTGEGEACKSKETKTEDGPEACKSTDFQDAGQTSIEGHDSEDVAIDMAASGDICNAESVHNELLQPTFEPEIVLETAPTCRSEQDSRCGEKEKATEEDEYKELTAESCDTTDLTEETIRTIPAENFDTTPKENECEIKLSEESIPTGADRSVEDGTPQDNESSEMSPQFPPPMHGEMTQEVEGKGKGTSVVILADGCIITGLHKVKEEASTHEKDYEEGVNKNEGANEVKRSLNEIPEPTEADSTNSPKTDGTILCHEELSAKGNNEIDVKNKQNEIDKTYEYEQMGRSSTTDGPDDLILLQANKETGESTGPDLVEEDPVQERTAGAIAHREDNVMVSPQECQVNPSTEEALDYAKINTEETNAEEISEGRPSKDDREQEFNKEVHTQFITFTSDENKDGCEREEDVKSELSPAPDEQEIENQKSKFTSDAISLKEEDKDSKDFAQQVEAACSIENVANTEKDETETCNKIKSTSIIECSEKEKPPKEHDEYFQSESPCAPSDINSEVSGVAERSEVPSANGSQAGQVSATEDGVPATDDESEAKDHAGSTHIAAGADESPMLESTESNVKEDELTDSGQEKGEFPGSADAIKELTESEVLNEEPKGSKDLGATEKSSVDTLHGSLGSILKTEAGEEEECEASATYEGPDKKEEHLYGTHSTEDVLMPRESESTKTVSESEEVETAKGSAQKEASEDQHVPPEVHFADLNIAEGKYVSATNGTGETENQIPVDQRNPISDEISVNTDLEMKEIEGENHDEALKQQESFAPTTDIKNRALEEKVTTENVEDDLKEDYAPDKTAFHSEVSAPIREERGAADMISTQNLKTVELTEQTETMKMEIEEHPRSERETCMAGEGEEEVQYQSKENPVDLVITPIETVKEDTINESDGAINRDIAAEEIEQEEVRPQNRQLDDRPNMASGICLDMRPSERAETDPCTHGEEVDGAMRDEISTHLLPRSSESDFKLANQESNAVDNPTIVEEEIELPSDKKDETRVSDVKESTETENYSSIQNRDGEGTVEHEEISERLATSAAQNGEAAEDGSAPDQAIPRESTLELLTPASVSPLEEKEKDPTITEEEIELPSDKKDETRASAVKESTGRENYSSIGNRDAEETVEHEEISERLATSADQNGEAAEDGSAPDQAIPRESTLELLTPASVSLLEEKENDPTITEGESELPSDKKDETRAPDVKESTETENHSFIAHRDAEETVKHEEISATLATSATQNGEATEDGSAPDQAIPQESTLELPTPVSVSLLEEEENDLTGTEEEIELPSDKKDETRASAVKESAETENYSSIENRDAEETVEHEEISARLATSATQNGEATEDGSATDQAIPQESTLELPTPASVSLLKEEENDLTGTEEEIELPSDKKDETRASAVKESAETENYSSIENRDAEETVEHEEISERLATSAAQNGEATEDGSAPDQSIPRESTLELLTPASVSLLKEEENDPTIAEEDIELPSDKKDETRASTVKESTERENYSSIENRDAEETVEHEEISERLATSAIQNGEATEDGSAPDQAIPQESTLELLTPASVSLLEEKDNDLTRTEEEIELPSDKKDETRASAVKEGTERENYSSIENRDAEETVEHEEISEKLATSATQNGEATEDGSAPDQAIPRESKPELLTPASMSLLEEKEKEGEKIKDDNEEEVEMQLNESLQLSSDTVPTEEACFDKKETNKDGVSKINSDNSAGEKDIPDGQKDGCTYGDEVLKVDMQEIESKTKNLDSPEVDDKTAEVNVIIEEASSIGSSKSENVHEVVPDVQTNESSTRLKDFDLEGTIVEATISNVEPEQKCEDAIEANDMLQRAITNEVVLHEQLKTEESQNEEELETGEGDKKSIPESCKTGETKAIDQAEQAQAGDTDNEEIRITKIENDDENISTSKTEDATKDIEDEVGKETDDFDTPTIAAVETTEIGIPAKEASSGVFKENVHEVVSDVKEKGSSMESEQGEIKGMKVEAVIADVEPEEKCQDAIGANDKSQSGITKEGVLDENKKSEETQNGEEFEKGEGDTKISEKKDFFGPVLAEDTEEIDQDEQAQAGNLDKEQICDKGKESVSVSKNEHPTKDFDEIIKKTDTLDELNATTVGIVETAAEISIPREEASGVIFRKGEHMHEVMSDVQTNASTIGSEEAGTNATKVEAITADVEPAEKFEDGIEEIDMSQNVITNEGMTDAHTKAPLLENCNISEKKDLGKAIAEGSKATHQIELGKAGDADNEEIQTSESKIHDRLKDCVEKEIITEAGTTGELNATNFIAVPETTEIKVPTEEASGFVLSKSEKTLGVVLDVQENERNMGIEDAEMKSKQDEEVMADGKPEEKREDAIEANDITQNAITSERVLESHKKAGGEEYETGEGDNASLLGSQKIYEKKDFVPVVAEVTEATDEVEKAESENADNEEIQTSKSKTDDKLEDSVLVWKTADATKDDGKKTIEEVDNPDEFNATTIAAAETEITMQEPLEEEISIGTSTVPPDSLTVQNLNVDDFERIRTVSESSLDKNSANNETIDGTEKTSTIEKLGLDENEAEFEGTAHQVTVSKTDQGKTVCKEETTADQTLPAMNQELLVQTTLFTSLPGGGVENMETSEYIEGNDKVTGEMELKENLELSSFAEKTDAECLERGEPKNVGVSELEISANESTQDTNEDEKGQNVHSEALKAASKEKEKETELADNVEQEMQNEQENSDGNEEINKQETMNDDNSKETHGTTPGNGKINQEMQTGFLSVGEITHWDEQTDAEKPEIEKKPASKSESYATVALEEEKILNGRGVYIAQTKDAPQDLDVTEEIKEELGTCYDKTDIAAMTSETGMPTIQQDDKPVEASPADLEGPSPETTEPGLILTSKNTDKENLDETSSISACQPSDREKENASIQNPHASESKTSVAGENDSSLFLAEEGCEEATVDENFRQKNLDGEVAQSNENIALIDATEVCCKKADSIKHADTQFEIQANQVAKDTSCEEDKEGNNQVENLKLELSKEESERRSANSASADQGNMGTQTHEISAAYDDIKVTDSKAAADDLEPEKHCDIATEAADTLKGEILHEEVLHRPGDADKHEILMKELQIEESCNPNETVPTSPVNHAICEEADSNAVSEEHTEVSYSTEKTRGGNLEVEEITDSKCDAQIQEVLHQEKTQEEENRGSVAPTEHETSDSEKLTKDLGTCCHEVDTAPKTSLTSTPISCMVPNEEKPVDDSGTGFDKEFPKEVETEVSLLEGKIETQLEEKHLAADDENIERENVTAENPKADGLGRLTIVSQAVLGSKDPGTVIIDAIEETTAEERDVSESRSHCRELVQEPDATSDQNTTSRELEVQVQKSVSALLQEEHRDEFKMSTRAIEGKQETQNVQETETVLYSSAAEAKEGIWQTEIREFEPPKNGSRGGETIQDDLDEKYDECCSTQEEVLEPEIKKKTKCTDVPSDSEKITDLSTATESHERGDIDELVKSGSQVKFQEDFNEPEDIGVEENQVHALPRDLKAEEKREETSRANETSQGENAERQIVERLEDFDGCPTNQEITKGSLGEDELHHEKIVEGEINDMLHGKASELQYQEDKSKHSAVDEDIALEEFDNVHVERETVGINSNDEAERNIKSEGATESEHQNGKTNSGSSTTDATTICNKESIVEKTQEADDLGEKARETSPVLEQKKYASIAKPEMPVSGEACLPTAPDVILTEGNEDTSPVVKERIVETIQNSKASNLEVGDPLEADVEPKRNEYGGERTCSSDAKTSEEDMSKDTSVVSLCDLLDKMPEGNLPTTERSSGERRPIDESDTVPPEEVKGDEHEDDEHERTELGHDAPVMVENSKDIDVKAPHKKSHNILSGVGSKVKHSISKVKKAITGKSSHSKAHLAK